MIKHILLAAILIASYTATAQVTISKDTLDAHPGSQYDILQAIANAYKLKLDLKSPRYDYNHKYECTFFMTPNGLNEILVSLRFCTDMDYILKGDILTVGRKGDLISTKL